MWLAATRCSNPDVQKPDRGKKKRVGREVGQGIPKRKKDQIEKEKKDQEKEEVAVSSFGYHPIAEGHLNIQTQVSVGGKQVKQKTKKGNHPE
jgi:hypothetical protein